MNAGVHMGVAGRVVDVQVLEGKTPRARRIMRGNDSRAKVRAMRRGEVRLVLRTGSFKNLILNQGLDKIGTTSILTLFQCCAAGTGNTATAVTQTGLVAEVARTSTILSGAGNTGTTTPNALTRVYRRTFDFPALGTDRNISELGFSDSSSVGANLFSRVLVAVGGTPTAVTVTATQQLRVIYELTLSVNAVDGNFNVNFGGTWGSVTGVSRVQAWVFPTLNTNGTVSTGEEPFGMNSAWVSTSTAAHSAVGTNSDRFTGQTVSSASSGVTAGYTAGTYYRERTTTFALNNANHSIGCIGIQGVGGGSTGQNSGWVALFSAPKVKTNTQTLSVTTRISWARM
jgi:hypothetical protein